MIRRPFESGWSRTVDSMHDRGILSDNNFGERLHCAMITAEPRIEQTALASMVTAVVGAIAWPVIGGWASLLAATLSLLLGFVALSRIKRYGRTGRWAAVIGIGFGVVIYAILIAYIAWDRIDPV